jgi:hypothetical protein
VSDIWRDLSRWCRTNWVLASGLHRSCGSLISATPTTQTVLISWAAGGTTTISVTITPATYRVRDCGPQISESEAHVTGQVTADTTGSIKLKSVKAKVCIHSWRALAAVGNVPSTPFKL